MRLARAFAALAFAIACAVPAAAQDHPGVPENYRGPDTTAQRAAMDRLAPLVGAWQGEANVQYPGPMLVHQTEQVERDLNGLLLVIRGTGHDNAARSGAPVFQAAAVISYDERQQRYEVRSYTHEGYVTTALGEFLEDGAFRWSFAPGGPVKIRFTIRIDGATWREVGEMSTDNGATWRQTIDLSLRRVS